jgi:branched-subunit amino acid transport protein
MAQAFNYCFPQRRPGFDPLPAYLRFVDKVALGQVYVRALRFSPVSAIPVFILTFTLLLSKGQAD